jgi:hypothetical protein
MNFILFVIKQIQFMILLFFVLFSLVSLFPIFIAHAAQFQSGVTIIPPTNPTEGLPTNQSANPTGGNLPTTPTTNPPVATCGLQIISGVPINYGKLSPQADLSYIRSAEQQVTYSNVGNASAKVMVKGSNWVGGPLGIATISGPESTHVANAPNVEWQNKLKLQSNEITLGQLESGQTGHSFWQLQLPATLPLSAAAYLAPAGQVVKGYDFQQQVTLDLIC